MNNTMGSNVLLVPSGILRNFHAQFPFCRDESIGSTFAKPCCSEKIVELPKKTAFALGGTLVVFIPDVFNALGTVKLPRR